MADTVGRFYDASVPREWARLERHRTEFAVTLRSLRAWLPAPSAAVLDAGSGPGRYALALSAAGYRVTLFDLAPTALAFAQARAAEAGLALAGCVPGDARDLGAFADASFDAVLLLGPLYHLVRPADRAQALREAVRVLRPGGCLAAAFITRYAPIRRAAQFDPAWLAAESARLADFLASGEHRAAPGDPFTDAYFAQPREIVPLMAAAGLITQDLRACEGIVSRLEDAINALDGPLWDAWVDLNYRLGADPSVHGTAEHLLYVGRKP